MHSPPSVHIVGMYKSGTSWLLHILAAHPEILAFREFDILLATHGRRQRFGKERIANLLKKRLGRLDELTEHPIHSPRELDEVVRNLFFGQGIIPIPDQAKREAASSIKINSGAEMLESLLPLTGRSMQISRHPDFDSERFDNTLGFANFRQEDFASFIDSILSADDASAVPKLYYEFFQSQCRPGTLTAFKAADQILSLDLLDKYQPAGKKIAIVRDGRDAAVSARHYEALMRKQDQPWKTKDTGVWIRLAAWSARINRLLEYADQRPIKIIRYEDLHADPHGVIGDVYAWLKVDNSQALVDSVVSKTRFEAVSGGRASGEEANSIFRKGMPGDWREKLTNQQAQHIWRRLGPQLERLGYGPHGEISAPAVPLVDRVTNK